MQNVNCDGEIMTNFIVVRYSILLLVVTYSYMLIDIGLRNFTSSDLYKIVFPVYIFFFLKRMNVFRLVIATTNLVAILIVLFGGVWSE